MSDERAFVRVPKKLLDEYKQKRKELVGLTYSAITEIMVREALKEQPK